MEENKIKSYKGFDKGLSCRGYQYEIGKWFEHDGVVACCDSGFHACMNPLNVFSYYPPSNSRYCAVEQSGDLKKDDNLSKVSSSKIFIQNEIGLHGLIDEGLKYIFENIKEENTIESKTEEYSIATNTIYQSASINKAFCSVSVNTGDYSVASNKGDYSSTVNTGDCSVSTNTGDFSIACNTGHNSAVTNTGFSSASSNTGTRSMALNDGKYSSSTNTGNFSTAMNTGHFSASTNTGSYSLSTNTGDYAAAINVGNNSIAKVEKENSIAVVTGYNSGAIGALDSWLVLTERDDHYNIIGVQSVKVDGDIIKPNVFYKLENGEILECNDEKKN